MINFYQIEAQSSSNSHPFLIITANDIDGLRNKVTQEPCSNFYSSAYDSIVVKDKTTFEDGDWDTMGQIISQALLLYCLEDSFTIQKNTYLNILKNTLNKWPEQLPFISNNGTGSHYDYVYSSATLFNSIIALDIIYNDLSPEEITTIENNISTIANWYKENESFWYLSQYGICSLWDLYTNNIEDLNYWKSLFDQRLLNRYIAPDGSWNQSPQYSQSRMGGDRISKRHIIDVLSKTNIDNYYSNDKLKNYMNWAFTFALTPFGSLSTFGDSGCASPIIEDITYLNTAYLYSDTLAAQAQWFIGNTLPNPAYINSFFLYVLTNPNKIEAIKPQSQLFEYSGAALWGNENSSDALQVVLYSSKEEGDLIGGHKHFDINSFNICAYGEQLIMNSGVDYTDPAETDGAFNYPGFTPGGGRWYTSNIQNTVLIGDQTNHAETTGNGLIDGLVGGSVEFAKTDAGNALGNGTHYRTMYLVQNMPTQSNGYFILMDEVKPDNVIEPIKIYFQPNTLDDGITETIINEAYTATINGYEVDSVDAQEYINFHFLSNPNITISDSYKGDFALPNITTKKIEASYLASSNGWSRTATVLFPEDGSHLKPDIIKINESDYQGAIIQHSDTFYDTFLISDTINHCQYHSVSYKASSCFFRMNNNFLNSYSLTDAKTFFLNNSIKEGFNSDQAIQIQLDDTLGHISSRNSNAIITFYKKDIQNVLIDNVKAPILASDKNWIKTVIPQGKSTILLSKNKQGAYNNTNHLIPGLIQAEHFDNGGNGIAYYDKTIEDCCYTLRNEDVDINGTENNYYLDSTQNGEWLEYTVDITNGKLELEVSLASTQQNNKLNIYLNNNNIGSITVPQSETPLAFETLKLQNLQLSEGTNQKIKIEFIGDGTCLDWIRFNFRNTPPIISTISPVNEQIYHEGDTILSEINVSDDEQVDSVKLFIDDILVRTITEKPYIWNSSFPDDSMLENLNPGLHKLKYIAYDNYKLSSEKIVPININPNLAPEIFIQAPIDLQQYRQGDTILIKTTVLDDILVDSVSLLINNSLVRTIHSAPYIWSNAFASDSVLNNLLPGQHHLTIQAIDNQQLSSEETVTITILENLAPTIYFTSPNNYQTYREKDTIDVGIFSNDDEMVDSVSLYLNEILVRSIINAPYEWSSQNMEDSQLRNLTPGQYLLKAISFDNKGLSTESQLSISVIENKAPSIAFLKPILNERFKETDTIMVELTANDDVKVDSISLSINGSPLRTISNPPYRWMAYSSEDSKLNSLSPGSHMLRVVATDNEGLITKDSLSFEIIKNQSPNIQFISPNNKQVIKQGNNFDIEALVTDDEKVDSVRLYINNITLRTITSPPYIWSSNKDADSILTTLLPGEHLIKILAVDNRGLFTSDSITIQITPNHAPEITLLKPNNTSQFIEGDNIEISAAITDDEQVNYAELYFNNTLVRSIYTPPYIWSSILSQDSVLAMAAPGVHELKIIATDNKEKTTTALFSINIKENKAPIINFNYPFQNQQFRQGDTIDVEVFASDDEQIDSMQLFINNIPFKSHYYQSYSWSKYHLSDSTLSRLSPGTYTLNAIAFDNRNLSSEKQLTFTINENQKPVIEFKSPYNNQTFRNEDTIRIQADLLDDEEIKNFILYLDDQVLSSGKSSQVKWNVINNEDGFLNNVSSRNHVIKIIAEDNKGLQSEHSIDIIIAGNLPPAVHILSPFNNQVFDSQEEINITANCSDDNGYPEVSVYINNEMLRIISSDPYIWSSSNSNDFILANLNPGTHSIKVVAKDTYGLESIHELEISIRDDESGVNLNAYSELKIYPNPANTILNIWSETISINSLDIFDINGKTQNILIDELSAENRINISHLNEGVYILKISTSDQVIYKKFIKQ